MTSPIEMPLELQVAERAFDDLRHANQSIEVCQSAAQIAFASAMMELGVPPTHFVVYSSGYKATVFLTDPQPYGWQIKELANDGWLPDYLVVTTDGLLVDTAECGYRLAPESRAIKPDNPNAVVPTILSGGDADKTTADELSHALSEAMTTEWSRSPSERANKSDIGMFAKDWAIKRCKSVDYSSWVKHTAVEFRAYYQTAPIRGINDGAERLIRASMQHLSNLQHYLDAAEEDLNAGAASGFWDQIELSAREFGQYRENMGKLADAERLYSRTDAVTDSASFAAIGLTPAVRAEPFVLTGDIAQALEDAIPSSRYKKLVRAGQSNFQFAQIYEMRRTRQALIDGFERLGDAIDGASERATSALFDLRASIESIPASISAQTSALSAEISQLSKEITKSPPPLRSSHNTFKRQALNMLDNIQRGRKPLF